MKEFFIFTSLVRKIVMSINDKKQIIDYMFDQDEVRANITNEFSQWLLENETDREIEILMLEKWEEYSKLVFEEEHFSGLKRIRNTLKKKERIKNFRIFSIISLSAAAIAILIFFAGFFSYSYFNKPVNNITLATAEGNIGEFLLPDGTKVWLNENTRLTYPEEFDKDTRSVIMRGEAFFEVIKDNDRPFIVQMPNLNVKVLGTSFGASCYEEDAEEEVVLAEGAVEIACESLSSPIILKPNNSLSYSLLNGEVSVEYINTAASYRWYESYLAFDNTRLGDILENLEHRYRVKIYTHTSVSMDKGLSLTITHEPLETIMNIIATLLPIKYEIYNDVLIIRDKY